MSNRFTSFAAAAFAVALAGAPPPAGAEASPVLVTRLRCEYEVNPLGIDVAKPRLSWILESGRRGEVQSAWQVLAASSPDTLAGDKGDLWDSGRVASDRSNQIVYDGAPLKSALRVHWKVRVWDREGRASNWSAPAWWEMGLLDPADWQAKWVALPPPASSAAPKPDLKDVRWIWYPEAVGNPAQGAPVDERIFRRRFALPAGRDVSAARVVMTADDQFVLYVNGKEAGKGGGWNRTFLMDVKKHIAPGDNVLAVVANNGGGPAGLIGRLRVDFAAGDPLLIATDVEWKAGNDKAPGWNEAAFADSSWPPARSLVAYGQAPWAEMQEGGAEPVPPGPCPHLRREFAVSKPVRRARAYATALGLYELRLNGARVGDHVFAPGWTDYRKRVQYQTYDIAPLLREGANAVGMVVADGWYAGNIAWGGKRNHYGQFPHGLAQIRIDYQDGSSDVIGTDEDWKASAGPIAMSDFLLGETYDARKELGNWDLPGFSEAGWRPAEVRSGIGTARVAQSGPPVRKTQELKTAKVTEPAPGAFVFDLAQNMVGWARLRVNGPAGQTVILRFAEFLNPDGTIYVTNLRGAKATDQYTLKGGGAEEVYEPRFTYHGFRYVEVTGYPGRPGPDAITGIVVNSDTPWSGTFECSSPLVNQLQKNITWGQRGNFVSIPTDCPQRDERLGWMGDAQIFVRTACFNMDVSGFFTKWMVDVEDAQSPEGAFPDVAPRMGHHSDGAPAWGDAGVIVPWTIHRVYGDTRILERHYDAMAKWVEYVRVANPDMLWVKRVNNNYGDWVSVPPEITPKEILSTAFFAYSSKLMARTAAVLGRADDARRYEAQFEAIKAAFNKAFVDPDGRIRGVPREDGKTKAARGDTQTCYVLPLRFGLLPEDRREPAARRLVELIRENGGHLSTGFLGVGHLLPSLTETGNLDTAYGLLLKETFPSWGYSIRHGATTIWERWDGWTAEKGFQDAGMNSFNHYSFGSVGEWMAAVAAGIDLDPEAPGYKRIRIRPRPGGGLTHARASYDSIHGRIVSAWRIADGAFTLEAEIPANTTAEVYVPAEDAAKISEGGRPAAEAEGVRYARMEDGAAVFAVGGGRYEFKAPAR